MYMFMVFYSVWYYIVFRTVHEKHGLTYFFECGRLGQNITSTGGSTGGIRDMPPRAPKGGATRNLPPPLKNALQAL